MTVDVHGPFVRLDDKRILAFDRASTHTSSDAGKTWSRPRAVFADPKRYKATSPALIRTRQGVLILAFVNEAEWSGSGMTSVGTPTRHHGADLRDSQPGRRTDLGHVDRVIWHGSIALSFAGPAGRPFVNCGDSQGLAGDQRFVESGCPEQKSSGFR